MARSLSDTSKVSASSSGLVSIRDLSPVTSAKTLLTLEIVSSNEETSLHFTERKMKTIPNERRYLSRISEDLITDVRIFLTVSNIAHAG